jgi:hypothetical protein
MQYQERLKPGEAEAVRGDVEHGEPSPPMNSLYVSSGMDWTTQSWVWSDYFSSRSTAKPRTSDSTPGGTNADITPRQDRHRTTRRVETQNH